MVPDARGPPLTATPPVGTQSRTPHFGGGTHGILLIPKLCPGGPILTCRQTLSTNQMCPWDWLRASDRSNVPIRLGNQHQLLFFCTSGKETVENLRISRGQLGPCQEKRIQRQRTLTSDGCNVLAPNAGWQMAAMSFFCCSRQLAWYYDIYQSQSLSLSPRRMFGDQQYLHAQPKHPQVDPKSDVRKFWHNLTRMR